MKRRILGRTNLTVGQIGVGCWAIGGPFENLGLAAGWDKPDDEAAKEGLRAAVALGANLFDTADVYGFGRSEQLIGETIERLARDHVAPRDSFVLVSKVGYYRGDAPHGFEPQHMRRQLEASLRNLQTSYLDIYFFHHLDFGPRDEYLEDAITQMYRFRDEGKVRYIGLRGPHKFSLLRALGDAAFDGKHDRFVWLAQKIVPDVISLRYNMLTPRLSVNSTLDWAKSKEIGILVYKPLAQGLVLDKYDPSDPPRFGTGDHRNRKAWYAAEALAVLHKRLGLLKERFRCQTAGDLARLAVRYCLSRCESACVVAGFRTAQQVTETFVAESLLDGDSCSFIESVFAGLRDELGPFFTERKEVI
jgi:methylglyoxal reductase